MYKYLLQSVHGIEWFGITTLLIFFCVFCTAAIRAILSRQADLQKIARLPLDD